MGSPPPARIACLDLDTFFVSVERLYRPDLIGQPVVVGAAPGVRGVVTAASYEVRAFGVRAGMSTTEAARRAPHAIFVPPRHGVYDRYAAEVKDILFRFSPEVQTASIDEFFLDFAGCEDLHRSPADPHPDATIERVVREMREVIQHEVGLPASAGIGTSRRIAKMASGLAKPAGVLLVRGGTEHAVFADTPVRRFPGIGPVCEARLLAQGFETLGALSAIAGSHRADPGVRRIATSVHRALHPLRADRLGRDRPAFRAHDPRGLTRGSISNERTFFADEGDADRIDAQLRALSERVAWRARRRDILARTVTLKLRFADFETITRSRSGRSTQDEQEILGTVRRLYRQARPRQRPIRLLGVQLSNLHARSPQLTLPFASEIGSRPAVGRAIDAVRARFGFDAIRLGRATPVSSSSGSSVVIPRDGG